MKRSISFVLALVMSTTVPLLPLSALAATPAYHPVRLFYYTNGTTEKQDFFAHGNSIDIFAPQTYTLNADGTLSGSLASDLRTYAKAHHIKVMPLVTNASFSSTAYKNLLLDPTIQATALQALISEAKNYGYWGWQFDFEQMDETDRELYSQFIQRMADGLHAAGLKLSVAVIAKVSDYAADYKPGLWHNLIGVYDYDALGKSADFLSIMSYDDPDSTGPVTELPWLARVLAYTLNHVPANKISLGLGLYYWARDDSTGKIAGIGGNTYLDKIIARNKITYAFDDVNKVPVMHYAANGTTYSLYYENGKSMKYKMAMISANHLYGFSAWALGLEVPSVWQDFK